MKDGHDRQFRNRELAFFATVTASVTHELANVVCIIQQVSGLLDDLIRSHGRGRPVSCERLEVIHERLSRQSGRATELIRNLNRFAHSPDDRTMKFEVNALVKGFMGVTRRFAALSDVTVRTIYSENEIWIRGDPFGLQQALFIGLVKILGAAQQGSSVSLSIFQGASGPIVAIQGPRSGEGSKEDANLGFLRSLLSELGGTVLLKEEGETLTLQVELSNQGQ